MGRFLKFVSISYVLTFAMIFTNCSKTTSTIEVTNMPINIDNEFCISYDAQSQLVPEDFEDIQNITSLKIRFGNPVLRHVGEIYYTVYSLSNNQLSYIFFTFSPNTGVNLYVTDVQLFSKDEEGKEFFTFLLPQDYPSRIFEDSCE